MTAVPLEYEVHFSKVRQRRGMDPFCVMQLSTRPCGCIQVWLGVSTHKTEGEADAALMALQGQS